MTFDKFGAWTMLDQLSSSEFPNEIDWAGTGSDRLIDAMFAWGSEEAIRARLTLHVDAGAGHVCIRPIAPSREHAQDFAALKALAPGA